MSTSIQQVAHRQMTLGEMLVEARLISQEQLRHAEAEGRRTGQRFEHLLVEQGLIEHQQLAIFRSLQLGIPYVNLERQPIAAEAANLVPESAARRYSVVPLSTADGSVELAMEDPSDIQTLDDLAAVVRKRIEPLIGIPSDIQEAIDRSYKAGGEIEKQLSQLPSRTAEEEEEAQVSAEAVSQAPIVRAIDLLLRQAARDRASDVHIEPEEDRLKVRSRIDGILHETLSLPKSVHPPLISRMKIMGGMNIAERRRPQDGQITFEVGDRDIDIRVATANTVNGEMAVLRILDKSFAFRALPELGFLPQTLEQYHTMLKSPFGMVLTSGPTGSGKTTTLYASVNQLDRVGRKIITIEDPVEYHFENVSQMQVHTEAGITFAAGLRACMRLDPDVILVGEIRDAETAQIAVQAALTGHLVLSSVHANDSVGVIFRLMDLGIEPFLLAQAIVGVVAQRMVRRVCRHCARLVPVNPEERIAYEEEMGEERTEFVYGGGCNFCANTGYLGRAGIFEVMPISEAIRRMILSGAGTDEICSQTRQEGVISLWHDGMLMVKEGITTPYEVMRNVYSIG